MPSITADDQDPAKVIVLGKSGAGKTGSLAALVAEGYNIRIVDTDKGIRLLRSLLTDDHYPYARLIRSRGIDLNMAVRYIPIDTAMRLRTVTKRTPNGNSTTEKMLAPMDAKAWDKAIDLLDDWKDGDLNLGSIRTWTPKDVLVFDSGSTLAMNAYYRSQAMNGRLGAAETGYDFMHDVKEAQTSIRRLLELIYDSSIKCNVVYITHITWVDETQGVAARPKEPSRDGAIVLSNPDGYPSAIGRALSPHMGKYFNDMYVARSEGSGLSVRRTLSTVPQDGVTAKNSVYLEREYPITTGLASIFAALRGQPTPEELIAAHKARPAAPPALQSSTQRLPAVAVA